MRGIFAISLFVMSAFGLLTPFEVLAEEEEEEGGEFVQYIGVQECKICHDKKEIGDQYKVWTEMKHAKAFQTLGSDKAKEIAKKFEIEDPQKDRNCLQCHSTAYMQMKEAEDALEEVKNPLRHEDGVQCESCHGPGDLYAYRDIMQNPKKTRKLRHVIPNQQTCEKCHNEGNPAYNPEKDTTPEGKKVNFYYPERWKKIQHYIPYRRRPTK